MRVLLSVAVLLGSLYVAGDWIGFLPDLASFGRSPSSLDEYLALGRPTLGRLAGVPVHSAQREHSVPPDGLSRSLLSRRLAAATTVDELRKLATWFLVAGSPDGAVEALERARQLAPGDPAVVNDLAVALLERWERAEFKAAAGGEPADALDLARAFDLALTAVAMAEQAKNAGFPDAAKLLRAARFNLALIRGRFAPTGQVAADWDAFLDIEPDRGWTDEARERRAAFGEVEEAGWLGQEELLREAALSGGVEEVRRLVARFVSPALDLAFELLAEGSEESVAAAEAIGRALETGHQEPTVVELVERWKAVGRVERERLVESLGLFVKGRKGPYENHDYVRAEEHFEAAAALLVGQPLLFGQWLEFYRAMSERGWGHHDDCLERLKRIDERPESRRSALLMGRLAWGRGYVLEGFGELGEAYELYLIGTRHFEEAGSVDDVAGIGTMLSGSLTHLGQPVSAWQYRLELLQSLPRIGSLRRQHALVDEAAMACQEAGLHFAYLDLRRQVVAVARLREDNKVGLAHALVLLAGAELDAGLIESAGRSLEEAQKCLDEADEKTSGDSKRDQLARTRADRQKVVAERLLAAGEPRAALEAIGEAISFNRGGPDEEPQWYFLGDLHSREAQIAAAADDPDAEGIAIDRGLKAFERLYSGIGEGRYRLSFFERAAPLHRARLERLVADGRPWEAFEAAEVPRARFLTERLGPFLGWDERERLIQLQSPVSPQELAAALPTGVALIEYALLDQQLVIWVLRDGRLADVELVPVSRHDLEAAVGQLDCLLDNELGARGPPCGNDEPPDIVIGRLLDNLGETLIEPVIDGLDGIDRLVIVPDGTLHDVPFPALRQRSTGRYLVQRFDLALAPSAAAYHLAGKRAQELAARPQAPPLVVSATGVDEAGAPLLEAASQTSQLAGAARGAERAAALLPGAGRLPEATEAELRDFLPYAGVFVFAGHSVADPVSPFLSYLLLVPSESVESGAGDDGRLYAYELFDEELFSQLPDLRLAVLASCEGAGGKITGEGPLSLASLFLAAGAPTVVAASRRIADPVAEELFGDFFEEFATTADPVRALGVAQRQAIEASGGEVGAVVEWGMVAAWGWAGD